MRNSQGSLDFGHVNFDMPRSLLGNFRIVFRHVCPDLRGKAWSQRQKFRNFQHRGVFKAMRLAEITKIVKHRRDYFKRQER